MLEVREDRNNHVLELHFSGKVTKDEVDRLDPTIEDAVNRHGKIGLVVDFSNTDMDAGAVMKNLQISMKHLDDVNRTAIIGDKAWHEWWAKTGEPMTNGPVQYFDKRRANEAWSWVRSMGAGGSSRTGGMDTSTRP